MCVLGVGLETVDKEARYMAPTLLRDVDVDAAVMKEEVREKFLRVCWFMLGCLLVFRRSKSYVLRNGQAKCWFERQVILSFMIFWAESFGIQLYVHLSACNVYVQLRGFW